MKEEYNKVMDKLALKISGSFTHPLKLDLSYLGNLQKMIQGQGQQS